MKHYTSAEVKKIIRQDIERLAGAKLSAEAADRFFEAFSENAQKAMLSKALGKDAMEPSDSPVVATRHDTYGNGGSLIARQFAAEGCEIHHSPRIDELINDHINGVRRGGNAPDVTLPEGPMQRLQRSGAPSQRTNAEALKASAVFGPLVKGGGISAGSGRRLAKAISNVSAGAAFRKGQEVQHRFTKATGTVISSNTAFSEVEYSEGDVAMHLTAALKAV